MNKDKALILLGMSTKHRRRISELKRKEVSKHLKLRKIELNRKRKEIATKVGSEVAAVPSAALLADGQDANLQRFAKLMEEEIKVLVRVAGARNESVDI